MSLGFQGVAHVGIVVDDLEEAVAATSPVAGGCPTSSRPRPGSSRPADNRIEADGLEPDGRVRFRYLLNDLGLRIELGLLANKPGFAGWAAGGEHT